MKVDLFASQPHYRTHLRPIFDALPPEIRGIEHPLGSMEADGTSVGLVAGGVDAHALKGKCRAIYVEHGAGQTYGGAELSAAQMPGYSLADGHRWPHVIGYICPSERVARNWTSAPSVAVGCPKLDEWRGQSWSPTKTVCFAWHWDATFVPEARSAWLHYASHLRAAVWAFFRQGYQVYGHSHPRWGGVLDYEMVRAGMTILSKDEDVFTNAEILIVDNSSLGPEMASIGRTVVWLNTPAYRREVNHGARFWDWADMAPCVDDPLALAKLDLDGLQRYTDKTHPIAEDAYAFNDGMASIRAGEWIADLVAGL